MRARHVFNVSSSTPAAMRFLLELGWFVALDSAATTSDFAGRDTAGESMAVDELSFEDCIFPSLAHPPIMRTKKVIKIVFLSMLAPP